MEREHRHLDRESEEECEEQPDSVLEFNSGRRLIERGDAERVGISDGMVMVIEKDDAQEHQHGTEQRVQKELDSGVQLPRTTPDTDQQIHRHQHRFPEYEEQEEVE